MQGNQQKDELRQTGNVQPYPTPMSSSQTVQSATGEPVVTEEKVQWYVKYADEPAPSKEAYEAFQELQGGLQAGQQQYQVEERTTTTSQVDEQRRLSVLEKEDLENQRHASDERRREQQFLEQQRIEQNLQEQRQRYMDEQRALHQEQRKRTSSLQHQQEELKGKVQDELLHERQPFGATAEYEPPKHERTILQRREQQDLLHRGLKFTPEKIAVVICGWPNDLAVSSAKACVRHGFRLLPFGLCLDDAKETHVDISDSPGTIQLLRFSDSQARLQLDEQLRLARAQDLFPVVVDTSEDETHLSIYQELKVPFVFESHEQGERHERAVRETERSRTFALISTKMDKRVAAVDSFIEHWARRFPGLFASKAQDKEKAFEFNFKTSDPEHKVNRDVLDAMSDLLNKDISMDENVELTPPVERQEASQMMKDHICREYVLKNPNVTFRFEQDVNGKFECGEGVAESVAFLAQKAQEIARPRVFDILDVAHQSRFLAW